MRSVEARRSRGIERMDVRHTRPWNAVDAYGRTSVRSILRAGIARATPPSSVKIRVIRG